MARTVIPTADLKGEKRIDGSRSMAGTILIIKKKKKERKRKREIIIKIYH